MNRIEQTIYIFENTPEPALYELLAEEASELAHAALKMARILRGEVPTNATQDETYQNLREEFTDVQNVAEVLGVMIDRDISKEKMDRWIQRMMPWKNMQCNSTNNSSQKTRLKKEISCNSMTTNSML